MRSSPLPTRRFRKKRYPLDRLVLRMAEMRTSTLPGFGGHYSEETGDGWVWHKASCSAWVRERKIKGGQWAGPWRLVHSEAAS